MTGLEAGSGGDDAGGAAFSTFLRPPFMADLGVLTGGGVGSFGGASSSSELSSSESSESAPAVAAAAVSSASTSSSSASGLSAATGAPLALKSASSLL